MCSNYKPVTRLDHLVSFFGVSRDFTEPPPEWDPEIWPLRLAPFFAKETAYGRKTFNARTETVAILPSFRDAWRRGQRCIVPAEAIYEPCYETGKAVRWRIEQSGGVPLGIAGIWTEHPTLTRQDGTPLMSFAMLTVNADGHPVFQRMHAPQDEKRMVVILHPNDYDRWLTCSLDEAPSYFRQWLGPLYAYPKPLPPRKPRGDPPAETSPPML